MILIHPFSSILILEHTSLPYPNSRACFSSILHIPSQFSNMLFIHLNSQTYSSSITWSILVLLHTSHPIIGIYPNSLTCFSSIVCIHPKSSNILLTHDSHPSWLSQNIHFSTIILSSETYFSSIIFIPHPSLIMSLASIPYRVFVECHLNITSKILIHSPYPPKSCMSLA